jgi:integrase
LTVLRRPGGVRRGAHSRLHSEHGADDHPPKLLARIVEHPPAIILKTLCAHLDRAIGRSLVGKQERRSAQHQIRPQQIVVDRLLRGQLVAGHQCLEGPRHAPRMKVAGSSYQPFTVAELQKLFDALPRETKPKRHTPETALPWVALMALYTGMRLEEIAQLTTADVREETANGARVWCIDVHNGGDNKLKNDSSARLIPVHSALVHLGLLDYVKALKAGPLFPGLTRRESKGGKVGARVGELFRKKLVALDLKRDGLCFHSFRHTVAGALDAAAVPQSDAARVLGHAVSGMSYGVYSQAGPGLKRVAAVVEQIQYEGLRL